MILYSSTQVAALYGITSERVRQLARARGLGTRLGEGLRATWVFTSAEVDAIKPGKPGRVKGG